MTAPPDDDPSGLRVHRPPPPDAVPDDIPPGADRRWLFDSRANDKPAVPLSPRVVGAILLALMVLYTTYLVLPGAIRGSRGHNRGQNALPSATASLSPTPTVSGAATPAPTGSPAATATPAPGSSLVPPPEDALQLWYDTSGAPLVAELDALIGQLEDDISARDSAAVAAGCTSLGTLATRALATRPPGDEEQVAGAWDDAFDRTAESSQNCVAATQSSDTGDLGNALAEAREALVFAQNAVDAAEARL